MKRVTGPMGRLFYSFGNIASSLTAQFFATFVLFYYVDTLKLPARWAGWGMVFYGLWNAINDPLAGQLSDRTRTRWGRRIPWVLFGALPLALAFFLVWTPPFTQPGQEWALFAWFVSAIFVYDTLYTVVVLNLTSLFPEMYPSMAERAPVSALRQTMGIIGNIVGVALPPTLVGILGMTWTAALFAGLTAIFLGLALLGSFERPEAAEAQGLPLIPALKHTFANKSFFTFVIASLFIQFTFGTLLGTLPFYTKYVLKAGEFQTTAMLGTIFLIAIPLVYVWSKLTVRWGARRAMITAAVLYGLALIPFGFATNFTGGIITTALLAVGLSGLMILFDVLIAECVDEDELKTGVRREGMYFGVNGFMVRLGISLQAIVMTQIMTRTGYVADLATQAPSAIIGFRLLLTIVPMLALAIAVLAMYFYPLQGKRLEEVRAAMEARQLAKKQSA